MANRRITQFPFIQAADIVNDDVITLVHVFEIDPALRNKKITFSGLREYLDQFYINVDEIDPLIAGNVIISGYAVISGDFTAGSDATFSGNSYFYDEAFFYDDVIMSQDLTVTGTITTHQVNATNFDGQYLEVTSGNFTIATGTVLDFASGYFDYASGTTITGDNVGIQSGTVVDLTVTRGIDAVSGWFDYLDVGEAIISGDLVISGEVSISGDIAINNISATGTISGNTITGNIGQFDNLTVQSGTYQELSGAFISGNIINFTNATGQLLTLESGDFNAIGIDVLNVVTTTGISGTFDHIFSSNLNVTGVISGTTITGDHIDWTTATGQELVLGSGDITDLTVTGIHAETVTGILVQAGDLFVSGNTTVTGNVNVTGDLVADQITVDHIAANSGNFEFISGTTITGDLGRYNQIDVNILNASGLQFSGDQVISGDLTVIANLIVSGQGFFGDNISVSGIISGETITGQTGRFDTFVRSPLVSGDIGRFETLFVETNATVTGNLDVDGNVNIGGNTEISGTLEVTGNSTLTDTTVSGNFILNSGDFTGDGSVVISGIDYLVVNSGYVDNDLFVEGNLTVSGSAAFDELTIQSGLIVSGNLLVSGDLIIDDDMVVSGNITAVTGIYNTVTGTTAEFTSGTFEYLNVTSGYFNLISGITITGTNINGSNGEFLTLSGNTITGNTLQSTTSTFTNLFVTNQISGGGPLTIDGTGFIDGAVHLGSTLNTASKITSSGGIDCKGQFRVQNNEQAKFSWGSESLPSITFTGDNNTGFYNDQGERVSTACGGQRAMTIESGTGDSEGRFVLTIWGA